MTTPPTSPTPAIPLFLIQIRKKGEPKKAPWTLFGIALSEHQAADKVAGYGTSYPDFDFRSDKNDWAKEVDPSAVELELDDLRSFRKSVVENTGTDDVKVLMGAMKAAKDLPEELESMRLRANRAEEEIMKLREPDALAAASPVYPFGVGDTLVDIYTDVLVKVTAVGRDATNGEGFDWEAPGGETGHCPAASVGCFEVPKKGHVAKGVAPKKHAKAAVSAKTSADRSKKAPHKRIRPNAHTSPKDHSRSKAKMHAHR